MHRSRAAFFAVAFVSMLAGCGAGSAARGGPEAIPAIAEAAQRVPDGRTAPLVPPTPTPDPISFACAGCAGDGSQAHPFVVPFRSQNVFLTAADARPSVGYSVSRTTDNHDHACLSLDQDPATPLGSGTVKYLIDTLAYFDCTPGEVASFIFQDTPVTPPSAFRTVFVATTLARPTPPPTVFPAGCPPAADGFGNGLCPAVELHVVGGGPLPEGRERPEPRRDAVGLLFAADGSFLGIERARRVQPKGAAFEIEAIVEPHVDADDLARYQWTIWGGRYDFQGAFSAAFTQPFAERLQGVLHVNGSATLTDGSYIASDGDGRVIAFGNGPPAVPPFVFTPPPGTESPVTVLLLPGTPQSHCGNCWVTLLH